MSKPRTVPVLLNEAYEHKGRAIRTLSGDRATFQIVDFDIPVVAGTAYIIWNGSTKEVDIERIRVTNVLSSATSGEPLKISVYQVTAYSGGTTVPIVSRDSKDSVPTNLVSVKSPTTITYGSRLHRVMVYPVSDTSNYSGNRVPSVLESLSEPSAGAKGVVLNRGEGMAVVVDNTIANTFFDMMIEFVAEEQ